MAALGASHSVQFSLDGSTHAGCPIKDASASAINVQVDGVVVVRANPGTARLRKHADYQRAYKASRKQFSSSMTYFCAPQPEHRGPEPRGNDPRVGITAGRVLGNAVERNRIKRRLREAIRANQSLLPAGMDVILHPRRSVLAIDYAELQLEIGRIFSKVAGTKVAASQADGSKAAGSKGVGIKSSGDRSSAGSGRRR